ERERNVRIRGAGVEQAVEAELPAHREDDSEELRVAVEAACGPAAEYVDLDVERGSHLEGGEPYVEPLEWWLVERTRGDEELGAIGDRGDRSAAVDGADVDDEPVVCGA